MKLCVAHFINSRFVPRLIKPDDNLCQLLFGRNAGFPEARSFFSIRPNKMTMTDNLSVNINILYTVINNQKQHSTWLDWEVVKT